MSVERTEDQTSKPVMRVYWEDGSEREIEMRMKMEGQIWGELLGVTGAREVVASQEEEGELRRVAEESERSGVARAKEEARKAKIREDKRLLEMARQSVN